MNAETWAFLLTLRSRSRDQQVAIHEMVSVCVPETLYHRDDALLFIAYVMLINLACTYPC